MYYIYIYQIKENAPNRTYFFKLEFNKLFCIRNVTGILNDFC